MIYYFKNFIKRDKKFFKEYLKIKINKYNNFKISYKKKTFNQITYKSKLRPKILNYLN